jgi:hypothetical protein
MRKRRPRRTRIMGKGEVNGMVVTYPEVDPTLVVKDGSMMAHMKHTMKT